MRIYGYQGEELGRWLWHRLDMLRMRWAEEPEFSDDDNEAVKSFIEYCFQPEKEKEL